VSYGAYVRIHAKDLKNLCDELLKHISAEQIELKL